MAAKRPSKTQIRARQRKLLEYIGTTNKTYRQAAKDLGVSTEQLRKFTSPTLRKGDLARSPAYKKLYKSAETAKGRPATRIAGVKVERFQYTERELQVFRSTPGFQPSEVERRIRIGRVIGNLYTGQVSPESQWAVYAQEHKIPPNINAMTVLYRNNRISDRTLADALRVWRQIYNINDRYYQLTLDRFDVIDDEDMD